MTTRKPTIATLRAQLLEREDQLDRAESLLKHSANTIRILFRQIAERTFADAPAAVDQAADEFAGKSETLRRIDTYFATKQN